MTCTPRRLFAPGLALLLALAAPAARGQGLAWPPAGSGLAPAADEDGGTSVFGSLSDSLARLQPHSDPEAPLVRLEAGVELVSLLGAKLKKGPEGAGTGNVDIYRDLHLPRTPGLGQRFLLELRPLERLLIGGSYCRSLFEGPPRALHYRGLRMNGETLPGGSLVRTTLDLQRVWGYVRYVIVDNERFNVAMGTGVSWSSIRLHLGPNAPNTRDEEWFGPNVNYRVAIRVGSFWSVVLENETGLLAPHRLLAVMGETHLGILWHLHPQLTLDTSVVLSNASLNSGRDVWGGGKPHPSYEWERAQWSTVAFHVSLSLRF